MSMISGSPEAWKRVGHAVRRRRIELGIHSQADLYKAGGPGIATISLIERGVKTSYEDQVIVRLEVALQWGSGSIEALLAGGEASPKLTLDTAKVDERSRRDDSEYPAVVGSDPAFRALYDRLEGLLTHEERLWAIRAVVMYRSSEADQAASRDREGSGDSGLRRA